MEHVLSQGVGYGVVIGLGFLFALGMILTTFVLKRTAGRTVKSGLVACAVVSSWTWAATLLQSSGVAYRYGVSGPFWYASGATVQVILFATLAIQLKRKAPNAHTFLEVIAARYGAVTHGVYLVFALATNILVSAMLLCGGSATVQYLTGMPTAAACFLLPVGTVLYTIFGGIKATFLTDYAHTVIIIVIIFIFSFTAYSSSELLGSPGKVWDLLQQAAEMHPVEGNAEGSYLTMRSKEGAIFFVINIVGNFGTVFLDGGYWQKAIAAHPVHALPGYIAGGLSWFAIPWLCATTMGLATVALELSPAFPSFPNRMSDADVSAGLVLPNAAVTLLGKGGGAATLLLIFMAVTSALSAELIAVSSIFTYDIYKRYINPRATGKQLVTMSHCGVVAFALAMAAFSTGLYYIGISMGYLYLLMGVIISSAVLPASLTLLWSGQSWWAATTAPVLGLACSLTAWLVTAKVESGDLSVAATGANNPMLAGNVVALLSPCIFIPVITLLTGLQKYDWKSMMDIRLGDDSDVAAAEHVDPEKIPDHGTQQTSAEAADEKRKLDRASKISSYTCVVLAVALLVLWPMPMYGSSYVFSKSFFTGWVSVAILWLFCSSFCVVLYPIWEGRKTSSRTITAIIRELSGKGRTAPVTVHGEPEVIQGSDASGNGEIEQVSEKAGKY